MDLLHAADEDAAEKPASSRQVTRKEKMSSQSSVLEKEMDGQTDGETGIQVQKVSSQNKVQTSKSTASGGNSCRNIFTGNLGVLPNSVLRLGSSTVNVSRETEISSALRALCSSIFHLSLCAFYREVRSARVNI